MKKNYTLVYAIIIAIVVFIASYISMTYTDNSKAYLINNVSQKVFMGASLFLLVQEGTFIKTKLFKFCLMAVSITLIGMLFKIMHWPLGNAMIGLGLVTFLGTYIFHFSKKTTKKAIDFFKVGWVTLYSTISLNGIFHLFKLDFKQGPSLLFLILILYYLKTHYLNFKK